MISVMDLERAVVTAAMLEQNANTIEVIERLDPECFESSFLKGVWKTVRKLHKQNEPIDAVTIGTMHEDDWTAIQNMAKGEGVSPMAIKSYAKKVRQAHNLRNAVVQMQAAIDAINGCNDVQSIGPVAAEVEKAFSMITVETDSRLPRSGREILPDYMDMIELRHTGHESQQMIRTGIKSLDDMLGGLNPVDFVAIGGCSGMGKTELVIKLCNGVISTGNAVLNFTMEMDEFQIIERSVADIARVNVGKLRSPQGMKDDDWNKVTVAMGELNNDLYWVHDESGITVEKVCSYARMIKNQQPKLSMIVVDYAQIMGLPKADTQNEAIGMMTRAFKKLAKELRCPVVLLSQLNEKQIKERKDKRPVNGDFYGSSYILNDADRVLYVYRDEVYHEDSLYKGLAEIIVGKNRFGQTGTIFQKWVDGHYQDIDQESIANEIHEKERDKAEREKQKRGDTEDKKRRLI